MSSPQAQIECLTTGSAGFDHILGGGIPVRSANVIAGEPGAGKTLFALQLLFHQARQGKKSLYFTTLSEPALKLIRYMQAFSFFDESFIGREIVFADLGTFLRTKGAEKTVAEITGRIEREEPALVVIDSFKALRDFVEEPAAVRMLVYDLAVHMAGWGATSLLVGEYTAADIVSQSEFAIADGIIRFSNQRHELSAVREIEILKLRGASYPTGGHFFEISGDGLQFFPRVRSPDAWAEPIAPIERIATGVSGLDAMLGGGLPRTSATVIQGGTGTGKTLLGLHFLLEGTQRGEVGIHFTLEETADQLRGIALGFGWDLRALEARGLLAVTYVSPVELSTDCFLDRARQQVQQLGARRVVLDSLTSMQLGVPSERRFKELVYSITKHFRALGATVNMNMEIADLMGSAQLSGHGISFAADNVIQLKYVEMDGHLERGISVLKARGVRHATDVRRMSVSDNGIDIGAPFSGLRGVLTGLPVPAKE